MPNSQTDHNSPLILNTPHLKTIRIAIAVAADGSWAANCWSELNPTEAANHSRNTLREAAQAQSHIVYVTAEVPLPQPANIQGTVEP